MQIEKNNKQINKFEVFTAKQQYNNEIEYIIDINAKDLKQAKEILSDKYNTNPFYTVIVNNDEIVYNEQLTINKKEYIEAKIQGRII